MTPAPRKNTWVSDARLADFGAAYLYSDKGAAPERVAALANRRRDPDSRAATVSLDDILAALD